MNQTYYRIKIPAGSQIGQEFIEEHLETEEHDLLFLNLPTVDQRIHARVVRLSVSDGRLIKDFFLSTALISVVNLVRSYLGDNQKNFYIFIAPIGDGRDFVVTVTLEEYVPQSSS